MSFAALPQLVDKRGKLPSNGTYRPRTQKITTRVWHHSLTLSHLAGSTAEGFSRYHVSKGWPGIGYAFVIEPKHIIQTPKGPRARIVYCHDINKRTYHVGDSNEFSLGICVAGDYRNESLSEATKASIDELQEALVKDGIGQYDKSHHEMPGYSWKACCVFNYMEAFKFLDSQAKPQPAPDEYIIQEGDTFWGIANNIDGITVDDLLKANPGVDPKRLQIGQKIVLGKAKAPVIKKPDPKPQPTYIGKRVESKVDQLRFYREPSWEDHDVVGYCSKGVGFPKILDRLQVGNGYQYKVANSRGQIFYITASPRYVNVQ